MSPLISVRNLVKTYPNGTRALKGVSFDVRPGEFLVVIGLSGSGKSTLLRCLNSMHPATSGEIVYRGRNIVGCGAREALETRRTMAMVFQHFNLVPRKSVFDNALMGALGRTGALRSALGLFSEEDRESARKNLELVGLADKAHFRASQLSGGQQQRVAIARALTQAPEILLADEPVASLDPATCHVVMDHLRRANEELGLTVVCNLHFLSLVRQYASRVIALRAGEIAFEGSPDLIGESWFKRIYGEGAREVHVN